MSESVLAATPDGSKQPERQIRRLIWQIAAATLVLMAIGSATRVFEAGLACPDWPLCYGQLVPAEQMSWRVFLEWLHRADAAAIGISAIALVGFCWRYRDRLPRWLPRTAALALLLVVAQGILGGLTVTELLQADIVTAHLGMALLVFGLLIAMGTALTPYKGTAAAPKLPWMAGIAAVLVYLQSLLGGSIAARWAVSRCLGASELCGVMNGHLLGFIPASVATLALVAVARRTPGLHPLLRRLSALAGGLLVLQVLLGFATFHLQLRAEPLTVAHQTVGAALLGSLVALTVLAARDRAVAARPLAAPSG